MTGTYAKIIMYKYLNKLVEGYKKYIGSDVKVQKTPGTPCTTLSKSDFEEPHNIDKYRSFVGQLMWYPTKVGPEAANVARELAVHISYPGSEHWNVLGCLIGYLKGK